MAKAKSTGDTVRLTYSNGVNVSVSAEKGERLLAGNAFTAAKSTSTTKADPSK